MKPINLLKNAARIVAISIVLLSSTNSYAQQEGFLGEVKMFAGNFVPLGWAFCEGQLLPISQYPALFSILGTTYGGDGRTTFALPDLRGRAAIHPGYGPGLSPYQLGQKTGTEYNYLTVANLPSHNHSAQTSSATVNVEVKASSKIGTTPIAGQRGATTIGSTAEGRATEPVLYNSETPDVTLNTGSGQATITPQTTIGNTGGSQPISNIQPVIAINYIICIQGVFPIRD